MLSASRITKRYGVVTALRDVDFSVLPGEIVALAGENGSGKSTLARVLSGGVAPDEGQVLVDGVEVRFHSPRDALDAGVAIVAQELTTVPHLSVAENVTLPFLRGGAARLFRRRRSAGQALDALTRLGVSLDPHAPAGSLGPVQQTFLEIAKALVTDPRFLILDEATSRLGPEDVGHVLDVVRELATQGVGSVLITHRIAEMTAVCHRVTVLRDGGLAGGLDRAELTERDVVRLMVGRDIDGHLQRTALAGSVVLGVRDITVEGSRSPVSLEVRDHEIVGMAGLVGAGRTEFLEALAGLRPRTGGSVRLAGAEIPASRARTAVDAGLALVPEDRHRQGLVLPFSVADNYVLGRIRGRSLVRRSADRRETLAAVSRFSIKVADIEAPITALSGGNQQKVVLARAVARRPRVLLLDEPTRGVDVGAREDIYRIIAQLADDGMAVLLASSDLVELINVCDRIVVMHEGVIVGEVDGASATEEEITLLSSGGGRHADVA